MTDRPRTVDPGWVFERDGFTCIDCHGEFPVEELNADHDVERQDGGSDDPANLVTRCVPCHKAKTKEVKMARKQGRAPTTTRATGKVPPKPSLAGSVDKLVALLLLAVSVSLASVAWSQSLTHVLTIWEVTAWLVVPFLAAVHAVRWVLWKRKAEAARIFKGVASAAGLSPAARRRMRVKHRRLLVTPVDVVVHVGPTFDCSDAVALDRLGCAFAAAHRVPAERVKVSRKMLGHVRLRLVTPDPYPDDDQEGDTPPRAASPKPKREPKPSKPKGRQLTKAVPLNAHTTVERLAATVAFHETCRVKVTRWWDNGLPATFTLTYAPGLAKRAQEAFPDLTDALTDIFPPQAESGRWAVRWNPQADAFHVEDTPDPLAPLVPIPEPDPDADLARGVSIGRTEDGRPWQVPLLGTHVLLAGASGSGKGSVLWALVVGLWPKVLAGTVRLWVCDPKGGQEFARLAPLAYEYGRGEQVMRVLRKVVTATNDQQERLADAGVRELTEPTREYPLNVVIVDELSSLTAYGGSAMAKEANEMLGRLLSTGRSCGTCVVSALQDPNKRVVDLRPLFTTRIALRLGERQHVDMVLGEGMRRAGAVADKIPKGKRLAGVGFMADEDGDLMRARAAFVPNERIDRLEAEAACVVHPEPVEVPVEVPVAVGALESGWTARLPNGIGPVEVVSVEWMNDDDEPADDPGEATRVEVGYRFPGNAMELRASFDRDDTAVILSRSTVVAA